MSIYFSFFFISSWARWEFRLKWKTSKKKKTKQNQNRNLKPTNPQSLSLLFTNFPPIVETISNDGFFFFFLFFLSFLPSESFRFGQWTQQRKKVSHTRRTRHTQHTQRKKQRKVGKKNLSSQPKLNPQKLIKNSFFQFGTVPNGKHKRHLFPQKQRLPVYSSLSPSLFLCLCLCPSAHSAVYAKYT